MQELITTERRQLAGPVKRLRCAGFETVVSDVDEAVDDLSEIAYLIEGLESGSSVNGQASLQWKLAFEQSLRSMKQRQAKYLDIIERASRWGSAEQLASLFNGVRKEYLAIKSALRLGYRQKGMLECVADWQSPIYSSSIAVGANRLTKGIAEHSWDYKRDGHLDALVYEEAFVNEYCSHLGSKQLKAYLTNSGMAAFTTVLHWLAHELHLGESTLALQPMYFENLHLTQAFFPSTIQLNSASQDELLGYLRTERPSVVLCDAVTNCGEVMSHDFETILHWAAEEADHKLAVVIDTTCLPSTLLPSRLLTGMPENVLVILVESLAKHHQFGMDTVTGGIVVSHMEESLQESFRKTRARLGTNIADASVGSLPQPSKLRLTRRMQRHARNTRLLAETLESEAGRKEGAIESVSWLSEGSPASPWYRGSCLTLRLRKGFRSIDCYREFESKVLELANARNHPIAFSTSFGFDLSRLYVTAPATRFEEPFLRISVGTETKSQIDCLSEILITASLEIARSRHIARSQAPAAKKLQVIEAPPKIEKNEISRTVFLGEESLKNYLCPANFATTPLVELPSELNPFRGDGVRLLAKMMPLVPLMNIKSVPAFSMLSKAAQRGELEGVEKIIESSSSNTVLSLSVIGKLFGIESTCAIVDHAIAPSLVRMLRLFGIEVLLHPGPGHELYGKVAPRSERATSLGQQAGWINPGQYSNPDNPEGFARWLAPDLWSQTGGRLSVLSCGLGTCGTLVGVSRGLREHNSDIQVVACCPKAGDAVPGPRERSQLSDVSFAWESVANCSIELTAEESFAASIKLLRKGILGGPSSGMNYAGMLQYLQQAKESGLLKERVERQGELWCVFLCCDSPLPHVDEYYDALGDKYFPAIQPFQEGDQAVSMTHAN
jgi:cysteine synthase/cystathionine beta-lyase/cystathionine gamma-synthase